MAVSIGRIMSRSVVQVAPSDTIEEAVILMNQHFIGAVMVVDSRGYPTGILTERDVFKGLIAFREGLLNKKCSELMQTALITITPRMSVTEAADIMGAHRVKRLPVISSRKLVGIVSYRDIANTLRKANSWLEQKTKTLADRVMRDPLTGLYNKAVIGEKLTYHMRLARKAGNSMAVMMIDIDFFKNVNDTYGHQCGDRVLKRLSKVLQEKSREVNVVGRYGGEEFLIIAPIADYKASRFLGERLCTEVAQTLFKCGKNEIKITVSIGVAVWNHRIRSGSKLIEHADTALYQAKHEGRNRVICADN